MRPSLFHSCSLAVEPLETRLCPNASGELAFAIDGAIAGVAAEPATHPITLDFENLSAMPNAPGNPIPSASRLAGQLLSRFGVRFRSGSPYLAVANIGAGHATSGVNSIGGSTPDGNLTYDRAHPIAASFFDPGDPSAPATTDFVSVRVDLAGSGEPVTLNAFDLRGNLVDSVTSNDTQGATLNVSVPGIHSVQFLGTRDEHGAALDDFTFNPVLAAPADSANSLFVTAIYPELLERPVDPVGLTHWVADLDAGFLTREDVVVEIQESDEGRIVAITDFYETLLNRQPDPVGLSSFLDFLAHHGHIADIRIAILASDEYFQQAGGTTDGFLNAIYADILGRPIDPVGKAVWSDVVEFDGRIEAAFGIAESVEAHTRLVDEFYNELLGRGADAVGLEFFIGFLQDGGDERDVVAIILGSAEYAERIEQLSRADLITNGSFETPATSSIGPYPYGNRVSAGSNALTGWTIGGNSVDLTHENLFREAALDATNAAYHGDQFIDLEGSPGPGSISQTVETIPGHHYQLSFAYSRNFHAEEVGYTAAHPSSVLVTATGSGAGAVLSRTFENNLTGPTLIWTPAALFFTANSTATTITFATNNGSIGYGGGIMIDAVSVREV